MTKNQLKQLFDGFHDPIVVLFENAVFYRNPAAKELVPAVDGKNMPVLLTKFVNDFGKDRFSTSALIGGKLFAMDHTVADEMSVFTLKPISQNYISGFRHMMSAVSGLMNTNIGLMKTAGDMITDAMPESELNGMGDYYASMQHSYYSAAHVAGNMTVLAETPSRKNGSRYEEFDIIRVFEAVISAADRVGEENSAKISFRHEREKLIVFADSRRIQRLLLNLLSNSMKYTPADGEITVSLSEANNKLVLQVSDNGCGISEEKMGTVWARYEQPKDYGDPKAGAGFGLSVVRQIASHHGGNVFIESKAGKGTTVTAILDIIVNGLDGAIRSPRVLYGASETWPDDGERELFLSELADAVSSKWYGIDYIN